MPTAMRQPASRRWNWLAYVPPVRFDPLARKLAPWFGAAALLFLVAGLCVGSAVAPIDAQQGEVYHIIFPHMPTAWMSMFIYLVMAGYCALGLVLRTRLSSMVASAFASTGALFAAIALWTGALRGKPTWGMWWVWGARLTSELLLLFLYFGFIALESAIEESLRAEHTCAVLAMVGVVNLPVIYFSVQWWNTLYQGASISLTAVPSMAMTMLLGMLLMTFACWMCSICVALIRVHCIMCECGDDDLNPTAPTWADSPLITSIILWACLPWPPSASRPSCCCSSAAGAQPIAPVILILTAAINDT